MFSSLSARKNRRRKKKWRRNKELPIKKKLFLVLTAVNVLLLLLSVLFFCNAKASLREMDKICSSPFERFSDSMEIAGNEYQIVFGATSVHIENSYRITHRADRLAAITAIKKEAANRGIEINATVSEMEGEWLLHNIAYSFGERKHAKDADLDYSGDRRWYVAFLADLLGKTGL